ncbi:MAG: iron-containing redox enzyme family protein [Actinomycetota bacterium]|nr:iron-containing redox enzyme family protein [Actinomycetota bacterium]
MSSPSVAVDACAVATSAPALPSPRGPLSEYVVEHLRRTPQALPTAPDPHGHWTDDDLQLALYICYELHYRSFAGVDERWEWHPELLRFRARLEDVFEEAVRAAAGPAVGDGAVEDQLWAIARGECPIGPDGRSTPSLSGYVLEHATLDQVRELAVHRSAYQLKEADPHTWAIPRLTGGPKAAMVEIQADEYGGGVESEMHCSLFAVTMEELGLDRTYGAYLDHLPGTTLATVNLISMFGLHRRLRAALVGHLAIFEMTSVVPMGRYAEALAALGVNGRGQRFYRVHVEADVLHQTVAARDLAGRLADDEPALGADILFGARAVTAVEARFTEAVLGCWAAGRSSLRLPLG